MVKPVSGQDQLGDQFSNHIGENKSENNQHWLGCRALQALGSEQFSYCVNSCPVIDWLRGYAYPAAAVYFRENGEIEEIQQSNEFIYYWIRRF